MTDKNLTKSQNRMDNNEDLSKENYEIPYVTVINTPDTDLLSTELVDEDNSWDNGTLGRDEDFVKNVQMTSEEQKALDANLDLVTISFRIDKQIHNRYKQLGITHGTNISALYRRALSYYMEHLMIKRIKINPDALDINPRDVNLFESKDAYIPLPRNYWPGCQVIFEMEGVLPYSHFDGYEKVIHIWEALSYINAMNPDLPFYIPVNDVSSDDSPTLLHQIGNGLYGLITYYKGDSTVGFKAFGCSNAQSVGHHILSRMIYTYRPESVNDLINKMLTENAFITLNRMDKSTEPATVKVVPIFIEDVNHDKKKVLYVGSKQLIAVDGVKLYDKEIQEQLENEGYEVIFFDVMHDYSSYVLLVVQWLLFYHGLIHTEDVYLLNPHKEIIASCNITSFANDYVERYFKTIEINIKLDSHDDFITKDMRQKECVEVLNKKISELLSL